MKRPERKDLNWRERLAFALAGLFYRRVRIWANPARKINLHELARAGRFCPVRYLFGSALAVCCTFPVGPRLLRGDPNKALSGWKAAYFIGFSCAMSVTIFSVALKFLGTDWLVFGIFFAVGLGFLALWRPRSNLRPS
jgi:hypothetical protein